MADQGKWYKLWVSSLSDPDLESLTMEDFGRWCRVGAFLKQHGTNGTVTIKKPSHALQRILRTEGYDKLLIVLRSFPSCDVHDNETILTVTFRNWHRYQGDMSTDRVRRFRRNETVANTGMKRAKRRTRGEERKLEEPNPQTPKDVLLGGFEKWWERYPQKVGKLRVQQEWLKLRPSEALLNQMLEAVEAQKHSDRWIRGYIPNPLTWIIQGRWTDETPRHAGKTQRVRNMEERAA